MELFRLKGLRIRDNEVFKDEVFFDFTLGREAFSAKGPYFTLLIGPNGTGKSNLLKFIIELFKLTYQKQHSGNAIDYPKGKYFFEYFLGDANYVITNTLGWENGELPPIEIEDDRLEKGIRFFKNGNEISPDEIRIPQSISALSIMLTDKFPVIKEIEKFPIYNYLGVRRDANTAGTRTYISRTIDHVLKASSRKTFLDEMKEMLIFLGLVPEFYITYSPRYKHLFFNGKVTLDFFTDFFIENKKYLKNRKTEPWSVGQFKALSEKEPHIIPQLVELLNYLTGRLENWANSKSKYFEFDIFKEGEEGRKRLSLLSYLHKLDIISYPHITLKKKGYFSLEESSSGEYHFISSIIGLLATVTDNSVVLIDEPEVSLHPNWQMKYINFLNKIFEKYNSAHFIISTHSHFLISDLNPEKSTILSLVKAKDENISVNPIEFNTYGWSAEQILLDVFDVQTTRNYYIAERIGHILKKASLGVNVNLDEYKEELLKYRNGLKEDDPLHYTITKIAEKYKWLD